MSNEPNIQPSNNGQSGDGATGEISIRGVPSGVPGEILNGATFLPPSTIRGVVFSVCIDWLTLSVPGVTIGQWAEIFDSLRQWIHFEDKEAIFGHGYNMRTCAGFGGIGTRERDGLIDGAVNLPGEAIRYMAAFGIDNLTLLKRLMVVPGSRLTRNDVTIDVFCERVKVAKWWDKLKAKQYVSRSRGKPRFQGDVDDITGFYVGSNASPRMLRVYNKSIEQLAKGIFGIPEDWTRIELQHRNKAADRSAEIICEKGLNIIPDLVGGFLRLLDDAEWNEIITGKMSLGLAGRPVSTPEQKIRWVTDQKGGIPKICLLMGMFKCSHEMKKAMQAAKISKGDIERWAAALGIPIERDA